MTSAPWFVLGSEKQSRHYPSTGSAVTSELIEFLVLYCRAIATEDVSVQFVDHVLAKASPDYEHIKSDYDDRPDGEEEDEEERPDCIQPCEREREPNRPGPAQEKKDARGDQREPTDDVDPAP